MASGHKPVQELGDKLRNEQQKSILLAEVLQSSWELEAGPLIREESRNLRMESRRLRQRAHQLVSQRKRLLNDYKLALNLITRRNLWQER